VLGFSSWTEMGREEAQRISKKALFAGKAVWGMAF
jgi:hypothetical protein